MSYIVVMIQFDWDQRKSKLNKRKHGVSFEEARTAFDDENAKLDEIIRIISARKATRREEKIYVEG